MHAPRSLAACLLCAALAAAQEERVETWPDGTVRERYAVDADGRKDGPYDRFRADGSLEVHGAYRRDRRNGRWIEQGPDGQRTLVAEYRDDVLDGRRETFHQNGRRAELTAWRRGVLDGKFEQLDAAGSRRRAGQYRGGVLHGELRITEGHKTLSRQVWADGELARLDGFAPFPVREDALRLAIAAVLAAPLPDTGGDPRTPERAAALHRLMAYRLLCRLPYADMELVAEWNDLCDAAAEVCRANGQLSHDPPQPRGMDDERYRKGHLGASRSNLSGGGMLRSVDAYMDDSDPTNIDRIGHRRWCLNPAMRKTGFGACEGYTAMWSMDGSGTAPRDVDAVLYPPAGWVPIDFFGPRRAWSIAPLSGQLPSRELLRATVRRLDEDWLPDGEPLTLDWLDVAGRGFGSGPAVVFRPVDLTVQPGARYLAEVSIDGGRSITWRYVVAFCAPISAPPRGSR